MSSPISKASRWQSVTEFVSVIGALASREPSMRVAIVSLWVGLGASLLGFLLLMFGPRASHPQPVQPRLPALFAIPDFCLTNQDRQTVSAADLSGQVWVADIIFSRCEGPCPKMTERMSEIQAALAPQLPVRLVSLTTDPGFDTPEVLRAYGSRFGAAKDRWWFLTGEPRALAHLAIDGLKFAAVEKTDQERTAPADLFVHSTFFVLVDQRGQARGVYHYGDRDMKQRLLEDIAFLLAEGKS
jgi:protein SCO1